MSTVVWSGSPTVIRSGNVDESMMRVNISVFSNMSSSFIGTSNGTLVCPAVNVTLYGPES